MFTEFFSQFVVKYDQFPKIKVTVTEIFIYR